MSFRIRHLSLLLRRIRSSQEGTRVLRSFEEWRASLANLPPPTSSAGLGSVLVVRLDDIGDFLLFRNQLGCYKRSARWADRRIVLLGNASWKEIFERFDSGAVDDVIWVNKGEYLSSEPYRWGIWTRLRAAFIETVIAPSRTRPLLLDDLCRLAAAPAYAMGAANTFVHPQWNRVSDALYDELFSPSSPWVHEFEFNGEFSLWICGSRYDGVRPSFDRAMTATAARSHLVCFVGANTRSRRWPARRWIQLIDAYHHEHAGEVILAGSSASERKIAAAIEARTKTRNLVGHLSLPELIQQVATAVAVVTNDTMALHLAVTCGTPAVVVANGVNHQRFTDYDKAGIGGVATIYPKTFLVKSRRVPNLIYNYADALTSDIASISAGSVAQQLDRLLDQT